jgi:hypothetical protein
VKGVVIEVIIVKRGGKIFEYLFRDIFSEFSSSCIGILYAEPRNVTMFERIKLRESK